MALYNFFKKNFYFIILLIPFIEFINKNFSEITIEIFFYFLIYSIIILISILIIITKSVDSIFNLSLFTSEYSSLALCMLFFSSIQLLFLGLIGEYLLINQAKNQNMPLVVERERINF